MEHTSEDESLGRGLEDLLLVGSLGLLPLAWLGLNAGYWSLEGPTSYRDLTTVRALAPLAALGGGFLLAGLSARNFRDTRQAIHGPVGLLLAYSAIGLTATFLISPDPMRGIYWGLAFVAVPLLAAVYAMPRNLLEAGDLLRLTLGITVLLGAIIGGTFVWRFDLLQALLDLDLLRVDFYTSQPPTDALTINANGAARFASVGLLCSGGLLLAREKLPREFDAAAWLGLLLFCLVLIYTRSRSAYLGLAAAVPLLVYLHRGWKPIAGFTAALGAVLVLFGDVTALWEFVTRGASFSELTRFGGRARKWEALVDVIGNSPWIGSGFHADRILIGGQAENAWLHATSQAGLIGLLAFAGAWAWTWIDLFKLGLLRRFREIAPRDRGLLTLSAALLAFFTVRSIPQSSGAYFGVDLLLLVPVFAYVHRTARHHAPIQPSAGSPEPEPDQPRVLVSAYACAPPGSGTFHGGEELLGWRLVGQISRSSRVHALVSAEHEPSITQRTEEEDPSPAFHFVSLPWWMAWMRDRQGFIQLYAYLWQVKAFLVARRLHDRHRFDLFHHLTYANDWMASYAGAFLGVPYVRGPGGGAQRVPAPLAATRGLRFRLAQAWRSTMQGLLRLDPVFRLGQERADRLLVCTEESRDALPDRWQEKAELFPVNGFDPGTHPASDGTSSRDPSGFHVVTAGKLLEIKGFDLALEGFARYVDGNSGHLTVYGDGPQREALQDRARELGIQEHVTFAGWRDRDEVLEAMAEADVFLFPSLRDGGGAVVVEAMAAGTPVVCLDVAGPGHHVQPGCGFAIDPEDPETCRERIADRLRVLDDDPEFRARLGRIARERANAAYAWDRLGDRIASIHEEVLDHHEPR